MQEVGEGRERRKRSREVGGCKNEGRRVEENRKGLMRMRENGGGQIMGSFREETDKDKGARDFMYTFY